MKRIRGIAAMLAISGSAMVFAPRAEAQVLLGWNSSLAVQCLNVTCTSIQFTLSLSGLQPVDNNNNPVPAAITALNSPGYPQSLTLTKLNPPGGFTFLTATVTSGGTWLSAPAGANQFNFQLVTPYTAAPVVVLATVSVGGSGSFQANGLAYRGANQECYNGTTGAVETCSATSYQLGDYTALGRETVIPEPMSMTLLGTGLLGLGLVGLKRRKQNSSK